MPGTYGEFPGIKRKAPNQRASVQVLSLCEGELKFGGPFGRLCLWPQNPVSWETETGFAETRFEMALLAAPIVGEKAWHGLLVALVPGFDHAHGVLKERRLDQARRAPLRRLEIGSAKAPNGKHSSASTS